jgi:hypothetical protein
MSFIEKFERSYKSIDEINYIIPDIQRETANYTTEKIYEFQKKYYIKNHDYCLNGTISIGRDLFTGIDYLLDGQHRMDAYKKLRKEFPERKMLITVDTFDCLSITNINLTYEYINTHNPNPITRLGLDDYKILQTFGNLMEKQFKSYLKDTDKPQKPHLKLQKVKDTIKEKQLIQKCSIKSGEELFDLIITLNKYYSTLEYKQFEKWGLKDVLKTIDKINKHENKLFIGMYSNFEWIDRLIEHVTLRKNLQDLKHVSNSWRPKISHPLKKAVWSNNNGELLNGSCYCCDNYITFDDFICGHIIPVSIGGETNINNMKAICSNCNLDMGTMNLEDYKRLLIQQST